MELQLATFELDLERKMDEIVLMYAMLTNLVDELGVISLGPVKASDEEINKQSVFALRRSMIKMKDSLPTIADDES